MAYNDDREKYNEYMRTYMLRRYHKKRKEALEKLGGACNKCGSFENLEIDHIDYSEKTGDIGSLWSYSKQRFEDELKMCQVLCKPCHIEKSKIDFRLIRTGSKVLQHGTQWKYKKERCRCEECIAANTLANKKYKKSSRERSIGGDTQNF